MNKTTKSRHRREFTRQFYKGNGKYFLLAVLRTVVICAGNLMISWLLQVMVDACTGSGEESLWELLGLCVLCIGVLAGGFWMSYIAFPKMISRAMGKYQNYAFQRLSRKSISAFARENSALYISALTNDAQTIEVDFLCNLFNCMTDVLMLVGALGLMLWYSPALTAAAVLLSALPLAQSVLAGNRVAEAERQVSERNEGYVATVKDCLAGFSVMKSFRAEEAMCDMFARQVDHVHDAKIRRRKASIWVQATGITAGVIAQFGVFLIGIAMARSGAGLTSGVLMAFVNLMNMVTNSIGTVPQYYAGWKSANALIDKLAQALDRNVREEGQPVPANLKQGITVKGLGFSYDQEPVLTGVDFTFEAGKRYAIVGASGSGKSTLLNLLMAAHDSYSGSICYDGTELRDIRSESLYELVSMVQQNVFVFNASIRDNITMFREFPGEDVDRAMALSGLTELVQERGEDYLCGENGCGLSGGEKQRISIARSLLRKSSVLLVDEATASLDARTAWQVSNSILHLDGLTRIVVTHALEEGLLKQYDGILTLKNGKLAEYGTFSQLMEKKGYFYSLYTVSQ